MSSDNVDASMETRTSELLDELIRCNDATREITRLNVGVSWNFGVLPTFQGTISFRDDTLIPHTSNFALFRTLGGVGDLSMKEMIDEGCGDIPDVEKEKVILYLNTFFRHARERKVKIREMICSRATLWLEKLRVRAYLMLATVLWRLFLVQPILHICQLCWKSVRDKLKVS